MTKGNIIDLVSYIAQEAPEQTPPSPPAPPAISHELGDAIESLIQRMREEGPLKQAK